MMGRRGDTAQKPLILITKKEGVLSLSLVGFFGETAWEGGSCIRVDISLNISVPDVSSAMVLHLREENENRTLRALTAVELVSINLTSTHHLPQFRNGVAEATVICSLCKYCDAIV